MGTTFKKPDTVVLTLSHYLQKSEAGKVVLDAMSEVLMMAKTNPTFNTNKWKSLETDLIEGDAVE